MPNAATLPLSRALRPDLDWRDSCPSTNSELVRRAAELQDLSVLATAHQTAGRGRLGRVWSAPAGSALAVSILVRHERAPEPRRLGWLPLVAGVAMVRAVRSLGVPSAGLKWPNDVIVDRVDSADRVDPAALGPHDTVPPVGGPLKLSGILTELTTDGVVIGAGLNLTTTRDDLPVPTATSLALLGVPTDADLVDRALAAYLRELLALVAEWRTVHDPAALRELVEPVLQTIGRAVRVDRPGLPVLLGTALSLDDDGRLRVRSANPVDEVVAVAAGDVTHLRYE